MLTEEHPDPIGALVIHGLLEQLQGQIWRSESLYEHVVDTVAESDGRLEALEVALGVISTLTQTVESLQRANVALREELRRYSAERIGAVA